MAKRVKPILNIPAVTTLEEADATLAQIAARKRELALIELGLKEDVDTLKLKCAEASEPIKQDIEVLEQALIRFGESKKSELFVKKRSRELTFGIIGFRASSAVKTMRKTTWEQVLGLIRDAGMPECIRTKQEVDKEALRQLPPERLAAVEERLENIHKQMAAAKAELGKPFPQEAELGEKSARLAALNIQLDMDTGKQGRQASRPSAKQERPSVLESLKRPLPPRGAEKKPKHREQEVR